jgi:Tfp pilus assembly protein PilZ
VPKARAHPRYALEIDAEISSEARVIPARTRNISAGGLCVATSQALPVGVDVLVRLSLVFEDESYSEALPLRGRVVWCTPVGGDVFQLGVTYVGLSAEQRLYVDLFQRYLKKPG